MSEEPIRASAEEHRSCDEAVKAVLIPLLLVLAALMGVYAILTPFLIPGPVGPAVAVGEAGLGMVFIAASRWLRTGTIPSSWTHPVFAVATLAATGISIFTYALKKEPLDLAGLLLIVMGVGVIVLSWRWFVLTLASVALFVGIAVALIGVPSHATDLLLVGGAAATISVMAHAGRLRLHLQNVRAVAELKRGEAKRLDLIQREADVARLQELDALKTRILNTASHELNTPLTPIRLQLHMLKRTAAQLDPEQRNALDVVDRNFERLTALVSDITDVARMEAGQLRLARAPTDVAPIAREAVASFGPAAAEKGLSLACAAPDGMVVDADPRRLGQVLYNLLSNAVKFTPPGGSIDLQLARHNGHVVLSVEDSGDGLTEEQVGRLFQPFSQVHDPLASSHGGTGLGLYISRGIAKQHGGDLVVESAGPGRGATFRLVLPAQSAGGT